MILSKHSMGIGDRFGRQGKAQLSAFVKAAQLGAAVTPVWNKSNREHSIIHTTPPEVRREADAAVAALGWTKPYHVDADHIGLATVDGFIASSDFFTLDVADFTGKCAPEADIADFVGRCRRYAGKLTIPGIDEPLDAPQARIEQIARKYLLAAKEAGKIYRRIEAARGEGSFITEVSMDETDQPQTPVEMFFILAAIAGEGIPAQTIAPKFTGRFNKGVDYVGDVAQFRKEFRDDLAVIAAAIREFSMQPNLKLSVHSGSDKFSLYGPIREALAATGAGVHLKTAGTTWLEEMIGLAASGGEGLAIAKDVYKTALGRFDELCKPYATVIDIDRAKLPSPAVVDRWSEDDFASALRHDPKCPRYNSHVRQMLHVGYKVAAEMGGRYLDALGRYETMVAQSVRDNILDRHIRPLFV